MVWKQHGIQSKALWRLLRSNVSIIPNPIPGTDGHVQIATCVGGAFASVSDAIGPTVTNCRFVGMGEQTTFLLVGASDCRELPHELGGATQLMTPWTLGANSTLWSKTYLAQAP